ncbi:MAG: hypothetical protein QW165_04190 [Candidatus Woesearchaeota archaeon]
MEKMRLEVLVRKIEPDGTETHTAMRVDYLPQANLPESKPEMSYSERCRKYFPQLYNLLKDVYERNGL